MSNEPILWIGKEQEGMYAGVVTLFIGDSNITYKEIKLVLEEHPKIYQLYFGAGCCTKVNFDVVKQFIEYNKTLSIPFVVTVEIDIKGVHNVPIDIRANISLILTINDLNFGELNTFDNMSTQIKIQNLYGKQFLAVACLGAFINTDLETLEGKTYKDDKIIK